MHVALEHFGQTQQELLRFLLQQSEGTGVDAFSTTLGISRNAVRQHLTALERDGFVARGDTRATGRRPEQLYVLTPRGREIFPRRYDAFADLMIADVAETAGPEALTRLMTRMGEKAAAEVSLGGKSRSAPELSRRLATVMLDVGYEAHAGTGNGGAEVVAHNCVFHHLAERFPQVCEFDLAFMRAATGADVEHTECMVRGGKVCRFQLRKTTGK
jgi:predicted ArsR family transcriptional regulator